MGRPTGLGRALLRQVGLSLGVDCRGLRSVRIGTAMVCLPIRHEPSVPHALGCGRLRPTPRAPGFGSQPLLALTPCPS